MKRLAWFVAVALATLTVVFLLWRFQTAVVLFILSLVVAAAVRPSIDGLIERKMPRGLAMAITYLLILAVFGGLIYAAAGPLIAEIQGAGGAIGAAYAGLKAHPPTSDIGRLLLDRLPSPDGLSTAITSPAGGTMLGGVLGYTLSFFDLLSNSVLVLVLSIYWGSDQVHFERLWLSLLPAEDRTRARNIWRSIETGVGGYVRSEILQSLFAAVLLALGFAALGVPYPVLLALICSLAWLVPLVGGLLALGPVVAAGLVRSPAMAAAAVALTIVIFLFLELVVERRLYDRRRYSSILVILVMIALADALGIPGLLVAPPLAAAIQIFFRELVTQPAPAVIAEAPAAAGSQLTHLKEQLAKAEALAGEIDEPAPEVVSLLQRLADLLERADRAVGEDRRRRPGRLPGRPAPRPPTPAHTGASGNGHGT